MIVVETNHNVEADAASTNTLVTDQLPRIPPHFTKLVWASFCISLLCFVFVLVDLAVFEPAIASATIVAFIMLLPYNGAAILLDWLHRHQTDSIFPFTPSSPRTLAYNFLLVLLWGASTIVSSIRLNSATQDRWCSYTFTTAGYRYGPCPSDPEFFWPSIPPVIFSSTELILVTSTLVVCWRHKGEKTARSPPPPPTPSTTHPPESKVISA